MKTREQRGGAAIVFPAQRTHPLLVAPAHDSVRLRSKICMYIYVYIYMTVYSYNGKPYVVQVERPWLKKPSFLYKYLLLEYTLGANLVKLNLYFGIAVN